MCPKGDSNSYTARRSPLKRVRLPIPPFGHLRNLKKLFYLNNHYTPICIVMTKERLSRFIPDISEKLSDDGDLIKILDHLGGVLPKSLYNVQTIGMSENAHPIKAIILGSGNYKVSILSGSHSDEPVGYETCLVFLKILLSHEQFKGWLSQFTFVILPDINPDGRLKNELWRKVWPDWKAYVKHAFREPPGRDLEFGYPDMRLENKLLSQFYKKHAPFHLHLNLHGMGFSEGGLLLIDRRHISKTKRLQEQFINAVLERSLPLHDHDRKGEKGFTYIGPGLTTTPESEPMREFFKSQNDLETAAIFHETSMAYISGLGGEPLCLVTELPLFLLTHAAYKHQPGQPYLYKSLRQKLPDIKARLMQNKPVEELLDGLQIQPIPLKTAVEIQLDILQFALEYVTMNG